MPDRHHNRCRSSGYWALVLGMLALSVGCNTAGWHSAPVGGGRDDIVAIRQFYASEPWLRDEEGRYVGLSARVYFVASTTPLGEFKGVFVRGTFKAAMHVLTRRPDGTYERQLAHEWTFTPQQAAALRVSEPSIMGHSYGIYLRWPPELELMNREIQVMFSYQRSDGEVVARRGSRFLVPSPGGASAAPAATRVSSGERGGAAVDRPTSRPHRQPESR